MAIDRKDIVLGDFNEARGASGKVVEPGSTVLFNLQFNRDILAMDRGQRGRVIVEAWSDEEATKAGREALELTSPAFDCP